MVLALCLAGLLLASGAWDSRIHAGARNPCQEPGNLTHNCGFDAFGEQFYEGKRLEVPVGWTHFVLGGNVDFRSSIDTYWGAPSPWLLSDGAPFTAGIFQQVSVTPGVVYQADAGWAAVTQPDFERKLGLDRELHLSHLTVSTVVFSYWGGLLTVFFLARLTQRWQYRPWLLIGAQLVSVGGMLMAALLATTALEFGLCFALSGSAGGLTYVSSLFYSINGPARSCGRRTAWHEGILGTGGLLGGLLSGEIAMAFGLRAPYIGVAVVVCAGVIGQMGIWLRCRPRDPATDASALDAHARGPNQ